MSIGTTFAFDRLSTVERSPRIGTVTASEKCAASPAGAASAPVKPLKKTPTAGSPLSVRKRAGSVTIRSGRPSLLTSNRSLRPSSTECGGLFTTARMLASMPPKPGTASLLDGISE